MKKVLTLATIVVAFVACKQSSPVTEENKKQMETFEADWKTTGEELVNWQSELDATTAEIKTMSDTAMNSIAGVEGMDSSVEVCKSHVAETEKIKTTYTDALNSWNNDTKAYQDWKATLEKGEVKAEDVTTAINDFTTKLGDYKANLETWKTSLENLKGACKAHCESIDNAKKDAKPADKKM